MPGVVAARRAAGGRDDSFRRHMALSLLVVDAYPEADRARLASAGGTRAGELYGALLKRLEPAAAIDVIKPADGDGQLPEGSALEQYDGVCWTGSTLTIHDARDDRVLRQIALARSAYESGCASFGSCWGAQIAAAAADGACTPNPRGREFGVARGITLTAAGATHPLLSGRKSGFMAFTSHVDMVSRLPAGATLLASNEKTQVQALEVRSHGGWFWAVQYHPEFDAHEIAVITRVRANLLASEGHFPSPEDANEWSAAMERIDAAPDDAELARELDLDASILDFEQRTLEVRNWLDRLKQSSTR